MSACQRFSACPGLIAAILRAHPAALCIASGRHRVLELPFEATTLPPGLAVPFVATETLHLTLAVVEHVLGTAFSDNDENAAWFQRHAKETVATFLPDSDLAGSSGFAVAKATSKLRGRMDVCRALFCCHANAFRLLRMSEALRNNAIGSTPLGLYEMNRRGRFNDQVTTDQHTDLLEIGTRQRRMHLPARARQLGSLSDARR